MNPWPFFGPPPCPVVGYFGVRVPTAIVDEIRRERETAARLRRIRDAAELRRYLRAVSPDLPLPRDAKGWWVRTERIQFPSRWIWPYQSLMPVVSMRIPAIPNTWRWQPFGGAA